MPRKKVTDAVPSEELPAALPQPGQPEDEASVLASEGFSADEAPEYTEQEAPSPTVLAEDAAITAEPAADAIGAIPIDPPAAPAELPTEAPADEGVSSPLSEGFDPPSEPAEPGAEETEPLESGDTSTPPVENLDDLLSEAGSPAGNSSLSLIETAAPLPVPQAPDLEQAASAVKTRRPAQRRKAADAAPAAQVVSRPNASGILPIDARSQVETPENFEDTIWHEIRNAYRTRRILTGTLGGVEQSQDGKSLVIVEYKGFRIVIPAREMMLVLESRPSDNTYANLMRRQNQILSAMMGAEIDFIVRGIDNKTRSVVASRKEAMLKKRQIFYLDTDQTGSYRIYEGRLVQARVTAVAEKTVRIEAFGVECPILARDLSWDWIGDARDHFNVGDRIVVRILSVQRNSLEDISIQADVKSVSNNTDQDNLKKCHVQGKYAGKVTDVHKGMVFLRLTNGVNAIAHACLDRRMPGKKDSVSFVVTHLDAERGIALGIITKIIKQNL